MMFDLNFSVTTVIEMKKIFSAFDISKINEKKSEKLKIKKAVSYDRVIKSTKKKF